MNETDRRIAALEHEVSELRAAVGTAHPPGSSKGASSSDGNDGADLVEYSRNLTFTMFKNVMKWSIALVMLGVVLCLVILASTYLSRYWS